MNVWNKLKTGTKLLIAIAVPLYCVLAVHKFVGTTHADGSNEPYSILIIAGQSNAAGVASYRSLLAGPDNPVVPSDYGLYKKHHLADTNTGFWWAGADGNGPSGAEQFYSYLTGNIQGSWIDSSHNGTQEKLQNLDDSQGILFGSEFGVGRTLYDNGRRKTIVLKVTYGLQSLGQTYTSPFIPFDWNVHSTNKSYDRLKSEFNQLTTQLRDSGHKYTVDGFFWMQGETDTLQDAWAASYQQNLTELFAAVRTDLQLNQNAHIVIGKTGFTQCLDGSYPQTGNYCGYPDAYSFDPIVHTAFVYGLTAFKGQIDMKRRLNQVRDAQQYVADHDQAYSQKVDIVETDDLLRGYDFTHLVQESQIELGKRFVEMYNLPQRFTGDRIDDYDQDGIPNYSEDLGRGASCQLPYNATNNSNLGDDDTDCDGYPNYLDRNEVAGSDL